MSRKDRKLILRDRAKALLSAKIAGDGIAIDDSRLADELNRCVTTHRKGNKRRGDDQFIRGQKTFIDPLTIDGSGDGKEPKQIDATRYPALSIYSHVGTEKSHCAIVCSSGSVSTGDSWYNLLNDPDQDPIHSGVVFSVERPSVGESYKSLALGTQRAKIIIGNHESDKDGSFVFSHRHLYSDTGISFEIKSATADRLGSDWSLVEHPCSTSIIPYDQGTLGLGTLGAEIRYMRTSFADVSQIKRFRTPPPEGPEYADVVYGDIGDAQDPFENIHVKNVIAENVFGNLNLYTNSLSGSVDALISELCPISNSPKVGNICLCVLEIVRPAGSSGIPYYAGTDLPGSSLTFANLCTISGDITDLQLDHVSILSGTYRTMNGVFIDPNSGTTEYIARHLVLVMRIS